MKKYQVIGGQYEPHWVGESDSLMGARIIAARHPEYYYNWEYFDNWQGWHKPNIYRAEDVEEITARGYITHADGETIRVPKDGAEAI